MTRPDKVLIDGKEVDSIALQVTFDYDKDTGEPTGKCTVYDTKGGVITVPIWRVELCWN